MLKHLIQKFWRIIEKYVEKLTEIELIKISDHYSTLIADASIQFRIIITILQKIQFFCAKTIILCCSFNINKAKGIQNNNNFNRFRYSRFETK